MTLILDKLNCKQEHSLQLAAKSTLLEEVNSLKLEAKELTDAHAREVERLNERLGQLERVHDTLDVTLAEEEAAFDGTLKARKEAFEAKAQQQEAKRRFHAAMQQALQSRTLRHGLLRTPMLCWQAAAN